MFEPLWWCTSTLTVLPDLHIPKVTVNKFRRKQKVCIWKIIDSIWVFFKSKCKFHWPLVLPVLLVLDWALLSCAGIGLAMTVIIYLFIVRIQRNHWSQYKHEFTWRKEADSDTVTLTVKLKLLVLLLKIKSFISFKNNTSFSKSLIPLFYWKTVLF